MFFVGRLVGLLCVIAIAGTVAEAADGPRRPNVLFISMDDLNDWVSVIGNYPGIQTPNFDRLAQRGIVFANAHCAAPVCNPSRTAIFTGVRTATSGVYENSQWWRPAMPDVVTLPEYFKQHGYWTEGAGKNFHHTAGFNDPGAWSHYFFWHEGAEQRGWEDGYQSPPDPEPVKPGWPDMIAGKGMSEFDAAPLDVPPEQMPDRMVARHAAAFLAKPPQSPFFLSIGFFKPHVPYYAPQQFFDRYPLEQVTTPPWKADDLDDLPPAAIKLTMTSRTAIHRRMVDGGHWKEAVRAYLACITFADAQLGFVLDALDKSPAAGNTIVVLWSDHGFHLGEKSRWQKWSLWRRSTHVPLLMAAPSVTAAGSRCDRPVNLVDLYPTLVELCGLPAKQGIDGKSFRPLLTDPKAAWDRPSLTTFDQGNHSLNGDRYHYIRYADGSEELYDFISDPNEWENLASKPEMAEVKKSFLPWLPKKNAEPVPEKGAYQFDPIQYTWSPKPASDTGKKSKKQKDAERAE